MINSLSSALVSYTLWNVCVCVSLSLLPPNTCLGISSALRRKHLDLNFAAKTSSLEMQLATGNIIGVQSSYPLNLKLAVLASTYADALCGQTSTWTRFQQTLLDSLKVVNLALKQQVDGFLTWELEYPQGWASQSLGPHNSGSYTNWNFWQLLDLENTAHSSVEDCMQRTYRIATRLQGGGEAEMNLEVRWTKSLLKTARFFYFNSKSTA